MTMVIDLVLIFLFVAIYLFLLRQNQFNALVSGFSLLVTVLCTRFFSVFIGGILSRTGYAKEGYPIVVFYLLAVIILWGIIYAVLSNIKPLQIEKNKFILSAVIAMFFTLSIGLIICFLSNYIFSEGLNSNQSRFCKNCKMDQLSLKKQNSIILSPQKLDEVIRLSSTFHLGSENRQLESEILSLINSERINRSLNPLKENVQLDNLATIYTAAIIQDLRFSHLDANNNSPADRASMANIHYTFLGENLAIASSVSQAHTALMNSTSHRDNILSGKFSQIGLAVYNLGSGSIILVEEFSD